MRYGPFLSTSEHADYIGNKGGGLLLIEEEMQVAPHDSGRHFPGDKTESSISVLHAKHVRKENIEMSIKKNNKMLRRAGVLLLVIGIIFSMGSAAFAAQTDLDWTSVPNLTTYNTPFNQVVTQGQKGWADFKVQGADSNYMPLLFPSDAYPNALSYRWYHQGKKGYYSQETTSEIISGYPSGYVAKYGVRLRPNVDIGANVLSITSPAGGYLDLGLIVNPSKKQPNTNVNVRIYHDSVNPNNNLVSVTKSVNCDAFASEVNYPTAIDSVASVAQIPDNTAEHSVNAYITQLKVGETLYVGGVNNKFWMYGVYGSDGNLKPISSKVGGEAYMIEDGDTIVWLYGTWGSLPASIS